MKKILALLLAIFMLLPMIAACNDDSTELSQEEKEALKGSDGQNGSDGADGKDGAQGAQGEKGDKGDKGDKGREILKTEIIDGNLWVTYSDAPNAPVNVGIVSTAEANPMGLDFYPLPDGTYGVMAGRSKYLDTIVIPSTYNGKAVTQILPGAFNFATNLKSITIPNSVTSIGDGAFAYCDSLTSVYITDIAKWCGISFDANPLGFAENLYLNGELVTELVIPESVTSIAESAFYGYDSLTSVKFAENSKLTSIGSAAFDNCTNMKSIEIPNSVTSIGDSAFSGCSSLTSVYITDIARWCAISFENYDANPLYYAGNLYLNGELVTELVIPDSVTSIGNSAFEGCTSLTSIEIPNSVTSIGDGAFRNCSSLTSIEIPNSVTSISYEAFRNCTSLTSITVDANNTSYKSVDGNLYTKDGKTLIQYAIGKTATSFTIPSGVETIGSYAFRGCTSLTSIDIPNSVTSIAPWAFNGCTSLTSVTFENTSGWTADGISISSTNLADPATAATYLKSAYYHYWERR